MYIFAKLNFSNNFLLRPFLEFQSGAYVIPTKLLFQARVGWSFFSSPKYVGLVGTYQPAYLTTYVVAKKNYAVAGGRRRDSCGVSFVMKMVLA